MIYKSMKKLFLLGILLLTTFTAEAQRTAKDVFLSMPNALTPQLTENNRLDMVDFLDSKMAARVTNSLEGSSELLTLSDRAFSLQLSEALRYDVRMLETEGDTLLCLSATFGNDFQESEIQFYTVHWTPLPTDSFIALPQATYVAHFFSDESANLQVSISQAVNPPATLEQEKEDENQEKVLILFKWNGKKYEKS